MSNMTDNYELTGETKTLDNGTVLHRISGYILGYTIHDADGWVDLSQPEQCWVTEEAHLSGYVTLGEEKA